VCSSLVACVRARALCVCAERVDCARGRCVCVQCVCARCVCVRRARMAVHEPVRGARVIAGERMHAQSDREAIVGVIVRAIKRLESSCYPR